MRGMERGEAHRERRLLHNSGKRKGGFLESFGVSSFQSFEGHEMEKSLPLPLREICQLKGGRPSLQQKKRGGSMDGVTYR